MTDREIAILIKERNQEGLVELIDRYTGYVGAILGNLTRGVLGARDLEELSADVFLSLWNSGERLREDSLRPYLAQIARNAAFGRLRAAGREPLCFEEDHFALTGDARPDELAIRRERAALLDRALSGMDPADRELFVRHYYFGETLASIAARLGLGDSTARSRLHRCRKKLRAMFEEEGYGYED